MVYTVCSHRSPELEVLGVNFVVYVERNKEKKQETNPTACAEDLDGV